MGRVSARAAELLKRMTLKEKVGQLIMALNAPGWPDAPDVERLIHDHGCGSLISCGYRTFSIDEVIAENVRLQELAARTRLGVPLLNGGDFEQGVVNIVPRGPTPFPQQMGVAAAGRGAREAARIAGREMRAMGFHWTFSPTADVNVNSANPVIGVRAYGDDPAEVSRLAAEQVAGYVDAGVLASPKHFPGHGAADSDSHLGLPVIDLDPRELEGIHLAPFRAAIAAGAQTVMTAHILVPALDNTYPATLSPLILTGLLRRKLGFRGLVITDQMTMQGVADRWGAPRASALAVLAGADVVLSGGTEEVQVAAIREILDAVKRGEIAEEQIDESALRVLRVKDSQGLFEATRVEADRDYVGTSMDFAAALAHRSITLLRNDGTLPLQRGPSVQTLVAGITQTTDRGMVLGTHVPKYAEVVERASAGPVLAWHSSTDDPSDEEVRGAVSLAARADQAIVFTHARGELPAGQVALVRAVAATGTPLVVVATGTPYDIRRFPEVPAYVATYMLSFVPMHVNDPYVLDAAVEVLFGKDAPGRLPVEIPGLFPRGAPH